MGVTTTVYIFSGTKVIAEYVNGAAPGSPTREYLYSGSQFLATVEGSTTKYDHFDHLSMRLTTDSNGTVTAQSGHYPFGENWYETGGINKLKFTSYERDNATGESGNDYAMFRSYINRFGRFSSPDPLAGSLRNPQSLNRYAYVLNSPINFADPLGLECEPRIAHSAPWVCAGGGGGLNDCRWDGVLVPCSMAYRALASGAADLCPGDVCEQIGIRNGQVFYAPYSCFDGGSQGTVCGYFATADLANGIHVFNGSLYNTENWNRLVTQPYAERIEIQRRELAQRIAHLSGGTISYDQAYAGLSVEGGFLQGGNYNFSINPFVFRPVSSQCPGGRCENAVHFEGGYVHLDTANPFSSPWGAFLHVVVDIIYGNMGLVVIPR